MTVEHITVLRARKPERLAKVWKTDSKITPYDDAKNYKVDQQPAGDIRSLAALLSDLQHDPHAAIIRGAYPGDAIAIPILEKEQDRYWQPGYVLRRKVVFKDRRSHMLMFDIDRFKPALADPKSDPAGCIDEFVRANLPECFLGVSCYWQLSNSAGHQKVEGLFNAHVWFWLDTPYSSAELKRWAATEARAVDLSLFDEIQLHYTANPLFEAGVIDPITTRSGFIEGYMGDAVSLKIAPSSDDSITAGRSAASIRDMGTDPVVEVLYQRGMVRGAGRDGALNIDCPRKEQHTGGETSATGCIYYPAHTRGYMRGVFHCLHGHCVGVPQVGFLAALGIAPDGDGGRVDQTDAGNVNALFEITQGDMSFVFGTKAFMHWDGVRWVLDPTRVQATTAVLGVAEHYRGRAKAKYLEADHATTTDDKKRLVKLAASLTTWANYCRSRRGIDAMLALAERDPRFVRDINDLDKDPYLFGVANGVVDLRTGDLRPAAREDLVTKASPFEFDPHASTKAMAEFVREICSLPIDDGATTGPMTYQARPEQERYMQKVLGYWLTGRVNEQKMWVLTGGGANGKSVLMDVVAKVLGAYAVSLPPEVLMASARPADAESPTPFARTLAGARLAISSEPREGQRLAASVIKRHTGEARLTARGMRENGFTFDTTHKLVLMTNDQPHIDHPDDAIRSRLHVVPFDRTWNRRDSMVYNPRLPYGDGSLLDRLLGDAKGVLLWLIEGARSYFKEGLDTAPAVKATTAEYLRVQDHFTVWLEGMEACDPSIGTPAATLFEAYQRFCTRQGAERPHPNNPTAFGLALKARNVQRGRAAGGQRYGLRGDTNNGASLF